MAKYIVRVVNDAPQWITVHPNGKGTKGTPVLIEGRTGEVLGGMGGKFNGKHISAVPQHGANEEHGSAAVIKWWKERGSKQSSVAQSAVKKEAKSGTNHEPRSIDEINSLPDQDFNSLVDKYKIRRSFLGHKLPRKALTQSLATKLGIDYKAWEDKNSEASSRVAEQKAAKDIPEKQIDEPKESGDVHSKYLMSKEGFDKLIESGRPWEKGDFKRVYFKGDAISKAMNLKTTKNNHGNSVYLDKRGNELTRRDSTYVSGALEGGFFDLKTKQFFVNKTQELIGFLKKMNIL